jgi:hypothetical protein
MDGGSGTSIVGNDVIIDALIRPATPRSSVGMAAKERISDSDTLILILIVGARRKELVTLTRR